MRVIENFSIPVFLFAFTLTGYVKLKDIELHNMDNNQVLATLRYDAKRKSNGALIDAQAAPSLETYGRQSSFISTIC